MNKLSSSLTSSLFLLLLYTSCVNTTDQHKTDKLHGYWKMDGFWQKNATQNWVESTWMKNGNGFLLYDGLGHMSIHITPKNYSIHDSLPQRELFMQDPEIYTLSNYVYSGNYQIIHPDSIVHHRLSHGNPAYNFTPTYKKYEIKKDTLYLYSSIAGTDCKIKWIRTP